METKDELRSVPVIAHTPLGRSDGVANLPPLPFSQPQPPTLSLHIRFEIVKTM